MGVLSVGIFEYVVKVRQDAHTHNDTVFLYPLAAFFSVGGVISSTYVYKDDVDRTR